MGDIADWDADRLCDLDDESFYELDQELQTIPYLKIARESELGWLIVFEEDLPIHRLQCWLPKSECTINEDGLEIEVPLWLVEKNGLSDSI